MIKMRAASIALVVTMLLAACGREPAAPAPSSQRTPPAAQPPAPQATWPGFVQHFIEARFEADPYFAVNSGNHAFDGRMPDWSRAALEADLTNLRALRAELDAFDAASLTPAQRFEREYLRWVVDKELFWQGSAAQPFTNPAWYVERLDPSMYLTREYAPLPQRLRGFLGYARAIPRLAANIRANLRAPLPQPFVERGAAAFSGYATFFRDELPLVYAPLTDSALQAELAAASGLAAKAMDELAAWLQSQRGGDNDAFALGAPQFARMLRATERVDIPLEELETLGRKDLERNRAALEQACAAFAPKATLAACVDRMRVNKPAGGTVDGARRQLAELRQFLIDENVVSIPDPAQALVAESPPYNRGNFAYISIPGPYESPAVQATYYVSPPDARWSAAQRDAYLPGRAYLLYVSAHEVWPGHYLQFRFLNRFPSRAAALWNSYAFSEGWAHYTEEMMYDAGLGRHSAESRIGMLTNALLRDVRFLSAICLHSGCMTLADSERMFREQAFADPGNARQQAVRGTYDPGYLAYTLGKLMIRKLRTDWLAAHPGATARQFHDEFLSHGAPPVPMVRAEMLGAESGPLF